MNKDSMNDDDQREEFGPGEKIVYYGEQMELAIPKEVKVKNGTGGNTPNKNNDNATNHVSSDDTETDEEDVFNYPPNYEQLDAVLGSRYAIGSNGNPVEVYKGGKNLPLKHLLNGHKISPRPCIYENNGRKGKGKGKCSGTCLQLSNHGKKRKHHHSKRDNNVSKFQKLNNTDEKSRPGPSVIMRASETAKGPDSFLFDDSD